MIPINPDRAVAARDYVKLGSRILVTSVFSTIQGEGPYAGYPAMFLRLSGCNYGAKDTHCQFCDTSFEYAKGTLYTPLQLIDLMLHTEGYSKKQILVISGGEPTLQKNLLKLIVHAELHFEHIQLETNGTQPHFYLEAERMGCTYIFSSVVSPKAGPLKYTKLPAKCLWWATCLKFVVSADAQNPHHEVPEWAFEANKPIYVSPMAVYNKSYEGEISSIWEPGLIDLEATAANYRYAAAYAMKHHLRLSLQTHLFTGIP